MRLQSRLNRIHLLSVSFNLRFSATVNLFPSLFYHWISYKKVISMAQETQSTRFKELVVLTVSSFVGNPVSYTHFIYFRHSPSLRLWLSMCTFQFLVYLSITFSVGTIEVHNYLTNVLFIRHPVHRIIKSSI